MIIEIVMTSRTCHQTRAPSREGGENRETLTAEDQACQKASFKERNEFQSDSYDMSLKGNWVVDSCAINYLG